MNQSLPGATDITRASETYSRRIIDLETGSGVSNDNRWVTNSIQETVALILFLVMVLSLISMTIYLLTIPYCM